MLVRKNGKRNMPDSTGHELMCALQDHGIRKIIDMFITLNEVVLI